MKAFFIIGLLFSMISVNAHAVQVHLTKEDMPRLTGKTLTTSCAFEMYEGLAILAGLEMQHEDDVSIKKMTEVPSAKEGRVTYHVIYSIGLEGYGLSEERTYQVNFNPESCSIPGGSKMEYTLIDKKSF
jgi:hypothetical protein